MSERKIIDRPEKISTTEGTCHGKVQEHQKNAHEKLSSKNYLTNETIWQKKPRKRAFGKCSKLTQFKGNLLRMQQMFCIDEIKIVSKFTKELAKIYYSLVIMSQKQMLIK